MITYMTTSVNSHSHPESMMAYPNDICFFTRSMGNLGGNINP